MGKEELERGEQPSWEVDIINFYLENFGTLASDEQYKKRLEVCRGCPSFGKVEINNKKVDGCTECGCPAATKPRVLKYFNPRKLRTVTVSCPLGKWAELDQLFI